MRLIFLLLFSFSLSALHAQFGFSGYYNANQTKPTVQSQTGGDYGVGDGYEAAVHYWFRLKNQRIEFYPTVYFASATREVLEVNFQEAGFQFKTNVYLFDFLGDCDCPTFGKQGPALEKGFFLQISPGYARYRSSLEGVIEPINGGGFTLGGGVGLDIGITNLLTITPFAGVRYGFGEFDTVPDSDIVPANQIDLTLTTLQLGLSATFRLDHKRY